MKQKENHRIFDLVRIVKAVIISKPKNTRNITIIINNANHNIHEEKKRLKFEVTANKCQIK